MKKVKSIFSTIILASFAISSCGGNSSADCMGSDQKDLEVCYKDKSIEDLAKLYCEWAEKEAEAKKTDSKDAKKDADNHTDAIKMTVSSRLEDDKEKFKSLTVNCKEK